MPATPKPVTAAALSVPAAVKAAQHPEAEYSSDGPTTQDVLDKAEAVAIAFLKAASKLDWSEVGRKTVQAAKEVASASSDALPMVRSASAAVLETGKVASTVLAETSSSIATTDEAKRLVVRCRALFEMGLEQAQTALEHAKAAIEVQRSHSLVMGLSAKQKETLILRKLADCKPLTRKDIEGVMAKPKPTKPKTPTVTKKAKPAATARPTARAKKPVVAKKAARR
jgi:hypothetical protein